MNKLQKFADILDLAAINAEPVEQLSNDFDFDLNDAYKIQSLSISKRYERGEKFVGLKMGFTSIAKMQQMGVHDLIWGRLTDKMYISNESKMERSNYIHPRAEPELCFRVAKDIDRELKENELFEFFDGIAGAIEIIDSRYKNFKFSLEDVIADNCSSSGFVIGSWKDVRIDISDLKIELFINNEVVGSGRSKAILGNPWKSVMAATRLAEQYHQFIPKGSIILAGAATPAAFIESGQMVTASIENLGNIGFKIV